MPRTPPGPIHNWRSTYTAMHIAHLQQQRVVEMLVQALCCAVANRQHATTIAALENSIAAAATVENSMLLALPGIAQLLPTLQTMPGLGVASGSAIGNRQ